MNIIIVILFVTGLVLGHLDRSKKYYVSENLYRKKIDKFKNYIPVGELKYQIKNLDDPNVVFVLKKYLLFRRFSRIFIIISFGLLISSRFI